MGVREARTNVASRTRHSHVLALEGEVLRSLGATNREYEEPSRAIKRLDDARPTAMSSVAGDRVTHGEEDRLKIGMLVTVALVGLADQPALRPDPRRVAARGLVLHAVQAGGVADVGRPAMLDLLQKLQTSGTHRLRARCAGRLCLEAREELTQSKVFTRLLKRAEVCDVTTSVCNT